jgi:uncharacterized protein DUF6777
MPDVNVNDVVTVPAGGLPAWSAPDPSSPALTRLPDGLTATVVERRGEWARVSAVGQPTVWVDAGRLVPNPAAPAIADTRLRRRIPLRAVELAVLAVSVGIAILVGHGGASARSSRVVLEPSASPGAGGFTASIATPAPGSDGPTATTVPPASRSGVARTSAAAPGVYAGVRDAANCDGPALVAALARDPARAGAWAKAAGVALDQIGPFVAGLTPASLRFDTRLTDYQLSGSRGVATPKVLQAGTAVLLDRTALPRVRCVSGDPLAQPRAVASSLRYVGAPWASFSPATMVVLDPAPRTSVLVLIDPRDGTAFARVLGSAAVMDLDRPPSGVPVIVVAPGGSFSIKGAADLTVTWDDPATPLAITGHIVKVPATAAPGPHAVTVTNAGGGAVVEHVYVIPAVVS